MRALVARAATLIEPDAKLQKDAPELISAMLAAGYDQAAARWAGPWRGWTTRMPTAAGRCWRSPRPAMPTSQSGRIQAFIRRDKSQDKLRSALLVAGLAGLGRISTDAANSLNRRYGLGLGRHDELDPDDRCGGRARPGGDGAGADRHRLPDAELRPVAGRAHVSCDRRR